MIFFRDFTKYFTCFKIIIIILFIHYLYLFLNLIFRFELFRFWKRIYNMLFLFFFLFWIYNIHLLNLLFEILFCLFHFLQCLLLIYDLLFSNFFTELQILSKRSLEFFNCIEKYVFHFFHWKKPNYSSVFLFFF